ncbi:MAG: cold shock domain-containing protein [Saprospiraceae bacterium]|nr:cold shock domain-containing protein [Saprospiraceae bacterium]MBK8449449.1 cold shock domain-containing protein [Saprospiraceae bacterium]MBK8484490.1 cold shock domain-containing protein [Saprospiraceae bacterium]MBK9221867.1 cold shock domain-containing protein [Saprospiraceae bacterium]MBK9721193.1 cold shock domain-containing protein [Saprospiraceae bacterium]
MGRTQETYSKKENEKKRLKKRQDKKEKQEERKANSKKGMGLENEFSYVDENGNVSSTPPDPKRMISVKREDIQLGIKKQDPSERADPVRTGVVTFFNESKGYGFIRDQNSKDSIFVHANSLNVPLRENDKVSFEVEKGKKGPVAKSVTIIK